MKHSEFLEQLQNAEEESTAVTRPRDWEPEIMLEAGGERFIVTSVVSLPSGNIVIHGV